MKIILASASPRRKEILKSVGLNFDIMPVDADESLPEGIECADAVTMLARRKARALADAHPELSEEEIGVCFISPCPAKASYVKNGFGEYKSQVDVVVSISDVYFKLINEMKPTICSAEN